ncbi:hypothetical protein SAMN06265361_10940 [Laceyella tengchongensis]|uniref:Uncharacterized protein n=2 Tax=Laceyella tengchongensis TaxID=574699 RepID=A0AA45WRR6_9BACL|nr:hypothetical protein SAMN06265361_10940 [Laceyella tengchongensis]
MVDGKEIVDTAYVAKICDVVEKAVKNNRKEVSIKRI